MAIGFLMTKLADNVFDVSKICHEEYVKLS